MHESRHVNQILENPYSEQVSCHVYRFYERIIMVISAGSFEYRVSSGIPISKCILALILFQLFDHLNLPAGI